jgi:hypothetical protein
VEKLEPKRAFEVLGHWWRHDAVNLRHRIHLLLSRREQHIDTCLLKTRTVGLKGARVAVEILVGTELQAIHKNAGDNGVAMVARVPHELEVPRVQVAHRRHECDLAGIGQPGTELGGGGADFHIERESDAVLGARTEPSRVPDRARDHATRVIDHVINGNR